MLIDGIKLYLDSTTEKCDRIYINKTSGRVTYLNDLPCIYNTFMPTSSWEHPTQNEENIILLKSCHQQLNSYITIFKIPDLYTLPLLQLGINNFNSEEEIEKNIDSKQLKEVLNKLGEFVNEKYLKNKENLYPIGLQTGKPNLDSVSYHKEDNCYVGLHVDNWDYLPLFERHKSRSLLCINLGSQDRFLLYINLTLTQIVFLLNENNPTKKDFGNYDPDDLVIEFFDNFPEYPILKFKLQPTEGYITPIQNIIHEGSTKGSNCPDIYYMALGYYQ